MTDVAKKDYYTSTEIAEKFNVHRQTILRWIRSSKIKAVKIGYRTYRISHEDLEAFVLKMKEEKKDARSL